MKRIVALPLLLLIALVLGCAPGTASRPAAALQDIGSIQDLQTRFARDRVLLLSFIERKTGTLAITLSNSKD